MNRYLTWDEAIQHCKQGNQSWVLATVLDTRGSTPRDKGSKMVITATEIFDTIGGGQLEYKVTQLAREFIERNESVQHIEHFPLSAKANQCCGGTMTVMLESFCTPKQQVHIFGAGHVAQALIPILAQLDVSLHWVDSRKDLFPSNSIRNTHYHQYNDIIEHIKHMRADAFAIIVTHQHSLDYRLVEALLDRKDCCYIGLIGSKMKAQRFKRRLHEASFSQSEIDSVICPIGLLDIPGKRPIEVAVSIAAQIIQHLHTAKHHQDSGAHTSNKRTQSANYPVRSLTTSLLPYANDTMKLPDNDDE